MGVSSTTNRMVYTGDGVTTSFSFPYYFFAQADLNVWSYDTTLNTATLLVLGVGYTITGTTNAQGLYPNGGSVVLSAAPASTVMVVIIRNPTEQQIYNLGQNQVISGVALNQEFDYLTLLIQRLEDQVGRAVMLPDGLGANFSTTLPVAISDSASAGQALVVNPSATGLTLAPVSGGGGGSGITGLSGDVSASGIGLVTATIPVNTVTNAKAAQMSALTIKGNATTGSANAQDLTAAQATAMLTKFSASAQGVVPSSPGGTTTFIRADGSWAVPPGTGGGGMTNPMTTIGDVIVGGASGTPARVGTGTVGQVLTAQGAGSAPLWATPSSVNPMTTLGDATYGGAAGAITRLAGDTSNTRKFMRTQASGGVATAPVWDTILATDVPTLNQNTTGSSASCTGNSATATLATTATNIAGGLGGSVPYQSAAGTTALLANGSVGQVLTSQGTTLAPIWSAAAGGMTNPMTTDQDIIVGGSSGTPGRLAVGSNGTVLGVAAGSIAWQAAGMANPMTTGGDVIYGGASGLPTRLANGTAGLVLTSSGGTTAPTWTAAPSGTKNYIGLDSYGKHGTITGWVTGTTGTLTNSLPTGTPTFGSGAAGTYTIASSAPALSPSTGPNNLGLTSSAATTVGNMVASPALAIDSSDQAKVLTFKFSYSAIIGASTANWSGTSSNSFGVAIWDVTNSLWIGQTANFGMTQSSGVGTATGTFQTNSNTASIRFVIYNANATSGAATLYFDDFFVGPQTAPIGAVATDWVQYTPTFTGFGTPTNVQFFSRRVGDSLEISGTFTSGTPTATQARITLGYNGADGTVTTAGSSAIGSSGSVVGAGFFSVSGAATFVPIAVQNLGYLVFGTAATSLVGFNGLNGNSITSSGQTLSFSAKVPITGWSSNVQMSSDTDTRVVRSTMALITSNQNVSTTANTKVAFNSVVADKNGAVNIASSRYVAQISGSYTFSPTITASSSTANPINLSLWKNGSQIKIISISFTSASANYTFSPNWDDDAVAGDYYEVYIVNVSGTTTILAGLATFDVKRLSGPSVIAATESVNARYTNTSAQSIPNNANTTVTGWTKDYDSHNFFGTGGVITIPVSGIYRFSGQFAFNTATVTANKEYDLNLVQAGSVSRIIPAAMFQPAAGSIYVSVPVSAEFKCAAGDTITLQAYQNSGGAVSVMANGQYVTLSVSRIGF